MMSGDLVAVEWPASTLPEREKKSDLISSALPTQAATDNDIRGIITRRKDKSATRFSYPQLLKSGLCSPAINQFNSGSITQVA